jgi:hypothetical protein
MVSSHGGGRSTDGIIARPQKYPNADIRAQDLIATWQRFRQSIAGSANAGL